MPFRLENETFARKMFARKPVAPLKLMVRGGAVGDTGLTLEDFKLLRGVPRGIEHYARKHQLLKQGASSVQSYL
jgi:hypothetical protein